MHCMSTLVDIPLFTSNWSACQYRPSILFSKTMTRTFLNSRNSNSVTQNGMLLKYFGISWRQVIVCCCWDCSLIILFKRFHMHSNSNSQLKRHPPSAMRSLHLKVSNPSGRSIRKTTQRQHTLSSQVLTSSLIIILVLDWYRCTCWQWVCCWLLLHSLALFTH